MAAIGMGLLWGGYWLALSGISMVKGWNNSPWSLANPVKPAVWTTQCYTGQGVIPTGAASDSGSCGASGGGSPGSGSPVGTLPAVGATTAPTDGGCPPGFTLVNGNCVSQRTAAGLH
jgi:hypothetical protein